MGTNAVWDLLSHFAALLICTVCMLICALRMERTEREKLGWVLGTLFFSVIGLGLSLSLMREAFVLLN